MALREFLRPGRLLDHPTWGQLPFLMLISSELRWFWHAPHPPADVLAWFGPTSEAPEERTDIYLPTGTDELGIKQRGGKPGLELKGLVARLDPIGGIWTPELWTKWAIDSVTAQSRLAQVRTRKRRWLRKFDAGQAAMTEVPKERMVRVGCNIELTEVALDSGDHWSTVGFEAYGSFDGVDRALRAAVAHLGLPPVDAGQANTTHDARFGGYAAWLSRL